MSMYLPNPDLDPTGSEPAEFLEIPPMEQSSTDPDIGLEQPEGSADELNEEIQPDITAGD
jgi:hypothetical protein